MVGEHDRDTTELTDRVMITAHGISQKRMTIFKSQASEIIDTTCPLVRRVHEATQTLQRENRLVILIGRRNHVEVQGIVEDLSRYIVVESPDQVVDWKVTALGIVSQSTTTPELSRKRCLARILELNPHSDARYIDTICRPTRQRQQALEASAVRFPWSSWLAVNTPTTRVSSPSGVRNVGCRAIEVESAQDLREEWFSGLSAVGLTAGTSTPDGTIEEIAQRLAFVGQSCRE